MRVREICVECKKLKIINDLHFMESEKHGGSITCTPCVEKVEEKVEEKLEKISKNPLKLNIMTLKEKRAQEAAKAVATETTTPAVEKAVVKKPVVKKALTPNDEGFAVEEAATEVAETQAEVAPKVAKEKAVKEPKVAKEKVAKEPKVKEAKVARKIDKMDPETNEVLETYDNIEAAAEAMDTSVVYLSKGVRGYMSISKGFRWKYNDVSVEARLALETATEKAEKPAKKTKGEKAEATEEDVPVPGDLDYIAPEDVEESESEESAPMDHELESQE